MLGREVDGSLQLQAVNSCLMMLPQIDNRAVFTVEGLAAADGALHPVQQAMVDTDATQCGFCTPGFVMAMFAFHHGGEPADSATMHEALAGNLCRCTGYRSIVEACRRVAQGPPIASSPRRPRWPKRCRACRHVPTIVAAPRPFSTPRSLDALFAAMEQHPDAILLAGGTDLGLRVSKDREAPPAVICLAACRSCAQVDDQRRRDRVRRCGHLQRNPASSRSSGFRPSALCCARLGSRQIRNLGTIAGNLATASPIGDSFRA